MKVICKKETLVQAVTNVSRAVSSKSTVPALEGILLQTTANGLYVAGYDLSMGITTEIEARVEESGGAVLSAKFFSDAVRRMPAEEIVITCDEKQLTQISSGPSQFTVLAMSAADYPELPAVPDEQMLTLDKELLRNMIDQTIFAVATGDTKPVHTGSLFDIVSGVLTVVSVDGYRLALRREKLLAQNAPGNISFVVPGDALSEVERICSDCDEPVSVTQGERHVTFETNGTILVTRRLEGEFLNYRQTIPQNNAIILEADCADLQRSIDRASLIINDKLKSPLRCRFEDGTVSITSKTAIGAAFDRCPIAGDGKGLEIGFNNRFLMEAVKAAPAARIRLELNTATSPCLILPQEGEKDNFLYMVLPVRLRAAE